MITFKQFLYESRNEQMPSDSAVRWMENYSEDYLNAGKWLYRGFNADVGIMHGSTASGTARKSKNTNNYYTLWMDNHPDFAKFPKRSRSFICSTNRNYAEEFGNAHLVVPKDTAIVGTTGKEDIWAVEPYPKLTLENWNNLTHSVLQFFGESVDDDSWEDFSAALKRTTLDDLEVRLKTDISGNRYTEDARVAVKALTKSEVFSMYEFWEKCFSPKFFGITHPAEMTKDDKGEVWIQEDCLFIPLVQASLTHEEQADILEFAQAHPKLRSLLLSHWHDEDGLDDYEPERIDPDKVSDRDTLTQKRKQRG